MHFTPERREVLPRRDVPVTVEPGPLLPARQSLQHFRVFGIIVSVVTDAGGHEPRFRFLSLQERKNKLRPIPGMPYPSRIGRAVDARSPVRFRRSAAGRNVLMLP